MLHHADNELLTRVGPGTPMGDVMRQYWIPACMSSELPEADGAPLRLRLLGKTSLPSAVPLAKSVCSPTPARTVAPPCSTGVTRPRASAASITAGNLTSRDAAWTCPASQPESNFKDKVRARAYPCRERNGIVWTYMGPRQYRRCLTWKPTCCQRAMGRGRRCENATGCRPWKGISTPVILAFCTWAAPRQRISPLAL